jgi:class 3 adenylate cyclase
MDPNQTQTTELLIRRRRSAILAADVAGYSRLMASDEEQTLKRLDAARTIMDSRIRQHGGRIANTAGDSVIAEFSSPVAALRCAVEVQMALCQRNAGVAPDAQLQFRIGLNYGEVVANRADLLGDNVNVAARIENLAPPGGILISETVHEQVYGRLPVTFRALGPQRLKNISRQVAVFEVVHGALAPAAARPPVSPRREAAAPVRPPARQAERGAWPLVAGLGLLVLLGLGAIGYLIVAHLLPRGERPPAAVTETPAPAMETPAPPPTPAVAAPTDLAAMAEAALAGLACAHLRAEVSDKAAIALTGYVGAAADLDTAVARLAALPGAGEIVHRVSVLPPPLCGVLDALPAAVLSTAGGAAAPRLSVGGVYHEGESLMLAVAAPAGADVYLTVDYVDAKENYVVHLLPNDIRPDGRVAAGRQLVLGDLPAEQNRYRVAPPFGTNLILVLATPRPLFDAPRPPLDSIEEYIPNLARALEAQPGAAIAYAPITFAPR